MLLQPPKVSCPCQLKRLAAWRTESEFSQQPLQMCKRHPLRPQHLSECPSCLPPSFLTTCFSPQNIPPAGLLGPLPPSPVPRRSLQAPRTYPVKELSAFFLLFQGRQRGKPILHLSLSTDEGFSPRRLQCLAHAQTQGLASFSLLP